ncbi:FkbM family methyltransferase [Polynucleobacter paneuropaeus]|nr:FkbM family methyltransferase [Polynucleobacter paneuropaeus]MBT8555586.1 FkbM family methyltransferase [Polynucleobacter paneuropaeus]MBT8560862.1 FkbM family methyltransferase [Polynucleobacter paneuropaeus]
MMAAVEHAPVLSNELLTIIDIGANRGQFALAARVLSSAKIISFEPLPIPALTFQQIFNADKRVHLHVAAIGESLERKNIHLSKRDDSSSLLEISDMQSDLFPGTHEIGILEIQVGRLIDFCSAEEILKPAMLKLDVQGFELQALKGCIDLIDQFKFIYCECSFVELYKDQNLADRVIDFLAELGFKLSGIYNPTYDGDGRCIQGDLLFQTEK